MKIRVVSNFFVVVRMLQGITTCTSLPIISNPVQSLHAFLISLVQICIDLLFFIIVKWRDSCSAVWWECSIPLLSRTRSSLIVLTPRHVFFLFSSHNVFQNKLCQDDHIIYHDFIVTVKNSQSLDLLLISYIQLYFCD